MREYDAGITTLVCPCKDLCQKMTIWNILVGKNYTGPESEEPCDSCNAVKGGNHFILVCLTHL